MAPMSTEDTRQHGGPPPPPPSSPPPPRGYPPLATIRRSRTDRHLAGVSGGLARYAGIDPLGWLLLPIEGEDESEGQRLLHGRSGPSTLRTVLAGIVAVIVGLILISNLFDEGPGLGGLGAVVVVAAIIVLVARNGQRPQYDPAAQPMYGPVPPPPPGAYGQTPGTAYATTPPVATGSVPPVPPVPPSWTAQTQPMPPPPPVVPPPPKERSVLGLLTFSATLLVAGLMLGWNVVGGRDFTAVAILASSLAVVGIGLVVGAFVGRAYGLIWLGILLSIATSLTAVVNANIDGGVGDRTWVVNDAADANRDFRLGIGEADLDMTGLPADENVSVDVKVGVGDLLILVPEDARVVVDAEATAGQLRILDEDLVDGTDLRKRVVDAPDGSAGPNIRIDAEMGLGEVEVRRATS
jgi:hypothetical protein